MGEGNNCYRQAKIIELEGKIVELKQLICWNEEHLESIEQRFNYIDEKIVKFEGKKDE